MGYFSNGSEGMDYEAKYCDRCLNKRDKNDGRGPGCAVWDAHMLHNYNECNNKESILHLLIPQDHKTDWGTFAGECNMFLERTTEGD